MSARNRFLVLVGVSISSGFFAPLRGLGQTFSVAGEPLRVDDQGHGQAVVLIPGWTQSLETWDEQVKPLRERFRVLRFDRGPWGLQSDPVDVLALLDAAGVDRAIFVAHSAGVSAALRFATNFPQRVVALVLYGPPSAPGLGPWNDEDSWSAHLERLGVDPPNPFAIANEHGVDSLLSLAASHSLFGIPQGRERAREKLRLIWQLYDGRDLTFGGGDPVTQPVEEAHLRQLELPTLIMIGEDELAHFRAAAERLNQLLPESELQVVRGGGHMVHLINPDHFNQVLLDFLIRLDGIDLQQGSRLGRN